MLQFCQVLYRAMARRKRNLSVCTAINYCLTMSLWSRYLIKIPIKPCRKSWYQKNSWQHLKTCTNRGKYLLPYLVTKHVIYGLLQERKIKRNASFTSSEINVYRFVSQLISKSLFHNKNENTSVPLLLSNWTKRFASKV